MLPILITLVLFLPHGDLSLRIEEKTDQIAAQPENWILYMQRGELRFQHDQADSALIDFTTALNNGLDTSLIHLLMAEAHLALGSADSGLAHAHRFLQLEPRHLRAMHLRGKLLEARGNFQQAVAALEFVINTSKSTRPQDYIELAELRLKLDTANVDGAIQTLRQGTEELGNIISLQMKIYELERKQKNYVRAHSVLDEMMKPFERKEKLLVEKADLFLEQGNTLNAAKTLMEAENLIASLPPRFQQLGAIVKLTDRIEQLKQRL